MLCFIMPTDLLNSIGEKVNSTSVVYSPFDAIQQVATQLQLGTIQGLQQIERANNQYIFSNAGIASQNIPVELVYVNTR